jgi:DNA excision repair protein ERCC-3
MAINPTNPVIVQGDGKVLLETQHPSFDQARDFLARFAELESSPDLLHTYRITPLSLWNAASAGMTRDEIVDTLCGLSKFDIPADVLNTIDDTITRYGLVKLVPHEEPRSWIAIEFATKYVEKVVSKTATADDLLERDGKRGWKIDAGMRGIFKQRLLQERWPVEDIAGFADGDPLKMSLRTKMKSNGKPFAVRDYQRAAVDRWYNNGTPAGGHGVVVLPCGAGSRWTSS